MCGCQTHSNCYKYSLNILRGLELLARAVLQLKYGFLFLNMLFKHLKSAVKILWLTGETSACSSIWLLDLN